MPIVSISRIQHRYGLSENLPQLAAAELGWAIDRRRLYIGNGPTTEGAPSIGNTEILTEYSNILEVAQNSYIYKDDAVGYTAMTGPDVASPTTRSLQAKLDDFANVRDYGAVGDGNTDDADAINRALFDLYCRESTTQVRRILYFPAGTYLVSTTIKIPTYAMLMGEGKDCTIIKSSTDTINAVARVADSKQQVGAAIGTNGGLSPRNIVIKHMTFDSNLNDIDVFIVNSTINSRFEEVGFSGGLTVAPDSVGTNKKVLHITSTSINQSHNLVFEGCNFVGSNFGAIIDDDMQNIVFNACVFKNLYKAVKIGENILGYGASINGPQGVRISNSLFDKIYSTGLHVYTIGGVTSAFNNYLDVGTHLEGNPYDPCIIFTGDGNGSICDYFLRTNTQNLVSPRIDYGISDTFFVLPQDGLYIGRRKMEPGGSITLANNPSSPINSGISFTASQKAQRIYYLAERGTVVRQGYIDISATLDGYSMSDTFVENGLDLGVTFSIALVANIIYLKYTTTPGINATFKYSIQRII